ncbi:MAG: threonylcarbamoyl-AMP synthase [Chloroflexi bacterium]|nr:threonylcarbamoyl-AMP synthase [Chloroflexota bacterium]
MSPPSQPRSAVLPILDADHLDEVVDRLRSGGIVAIPTDTVYGLACLPTHEGALGALADLKGREREQPIAALIDSVADIIAYLDAPNALDPYVRFWPGALTVIVRATPGGLLPPVVTEAGTVGVRKPDDRIARAVIRGCGGVLAVTSANRHGQPPCTSAEAVAAEFGPALVILDGGDRDGGQASTVVDASGETPRILREGPLSAADLGITE